MSGQMFMSWWTYFRNILFVIVSCLYSDRDEVAYEGLVAGGSCYGVSRMYASVVLLSCEMRFCMVLGRDVLVTALCLGCL